MDTTHNGSCLCGAVTFKVTGDFKKFFFCHCSRCQKTSGTAHCANLFAPNASLEWLTGEDKISFYNHPDTGFSRNFCSICSSIMPRSSEANNVVMVPAGSLDTAVELSPQAHIFTDSKGNWDSILNDIHVFEEGPH
ncbi:GFA family protein [Reinekea thalattae]|uniref:GFA family protein n=1 Tax=Reinekea thalattae TaxID=2593301 RepID=A0A5C8ZD81_9GAMM|nr:GFA family protein [Reinekea thalattae]TXR54876.1 GFA family protein [Reinekea thalattae]